MTRYRDRETGEVVEVTFTEWGVWEIQVPWEPWVLRFSDANFRARFEPVEVE